MKRIIYSGLLLMLSLALQGQAGRIKLLPETAKRLSTLDTTFSANYVASTDQAINKLTSITEANDVLIRLPVPGPATVGLSYTVNQIDRNNDALGFTIVQVDGVDFSMYHAGDTAQAVSFTPDLDEIFMFQTIYLDGAYRWLATKLSSAKVYELPSIDAIQKSYFETGERIRLLTNDAYYKIADASLNAFSTDTVAVIPTNGGVKFAILEPTDRYTFKLEWFGGQGQTGVDNRMAFQKAIDFTTADKKGTIELQNGKTYEAVMPIRGSMEQPYVRYVLYGRTGMSFAAANVEGKDLPKIYFKPPSGFKTAGNLDGNGFLIDNVTDQVDSLYFEGIHFWVPEDTMFLADSTMNNVPTMFYRYNAPGSPANRSFKFVHCIFENMSNPQISNQNSIIDGLDLDGCEFWNLGGWHTGFHGSDSAPGTRARQAMQVWTNPTDQDSFFINPWGNIATGQAVAYWFSGGQEVNRAALLDYSFNRTYTDTLLYFSADTLFVRNNSSTVDSIVIVSQSTTLIPNSNFRYVETGDLTFAPAKNVRIRNCKWYGGMNDQADHPLYWSRSVEDFVVENCEYYHQYKKPGVRDLWIRDGGGFHFKGGKYKNGRITNIKGYNQATTFLRAGQWDNVIVTNCQFILNQAAPASPSSVFDGASVHENIKITGCTFTNETFYPVAAMGGGSINIPEGAAANIILSNTKIEGFARPLLLQYSNWYINDLIIISPDSSKSVIRGENLNGRQDRIVQMDNVSITQQSSQAAAGNEHIISSANVEINQLMESPPLSELRIQKAKDVRVNNNEIGLIRLGYDPGTLPDSGTVIVHNNPFSAIIYGQSNDKQDSVYLLGNYVYINANRNDTLFVIDAASDIMTLYDTEKDIIIRDDGTTGRGISRITPRVVSPAGFTTYRLYNKGDHAITIDGDNGNIRLASDIAIASGAFVELYYDLEKDSNYVVEYASGIWTKRSDRSIVLNSPLGSAADLSETEYVDLSFAHDGPGFGSNNLSFLKASSSFRNTSLQTGNFTHYNLSVLIPTDIGAAISGDQVGLKLSFFNQDNTNAAHVLGATRAFIANQLQYGNFNNTLVGTFIGMDIAAYNQNGNSRITDDIAIRIRSINNAGTISNKTGLQIQDLLGTNVQGIDQQGSDDANTFAGPTTINNHLTVNGDYLGINNPYGGANTAQASIDSLALTYVLFPAIPYTQTDSIAVDTSLNSFPITARLAGDTLRQITYSVTQAPSIDLDLRVLIWDGTNYTAAFSGTIPAGQSSVTITGAVAVATNERIFPEILTDSGASGLDLELKFQKP